MSTCCNLNSPEIWRPGRNKLDGNKFWSPGMVIYFTLSSWRIFWYLGKPLLQAETCNEKEVRIDLHNMLIKWVKEDCVGVGSKRELRNHKEKWTLKFVKVINKMKFISLKDHSVGLKQFLSFFQAKFPISL